MSPGASLKRLDAGKLWLWWERAGVYAILTLLVIVFAATNPWFRKPANLSNILLQCAPLGVAAIGMTFAIISGAFDLSVGATMGLTACVFVSLIGSVGFLAALLVAAAAGFALGAVNGLIVAFANVTPFIATLGTMWVYRALAYIYTENEPVTSDDAVFRALGGEVAHVPVVFVAMLGLYAAAWALLHRTPFGRTVFAVGSSRRAAVISGISEPRVTVLVFGLVGLFGALGGATLAVRLGSAKADTALGYELTVIAAVVLGGTSLKGGSGRLAGTFGAAVLFATIYNAMDMYGVPSFWQRIALGGVLLVALSLDAIRNRLRGGST